LVISLATTQDILVTQVEQLYSHLSQTLDAVLKEEEEEDAPFMTYRIRLDQIFTQALTALVTSFTANFNRQHTDLTYLTQLQECGFLVTFESLLR